MSNQRFTDGTPVYHDCVHESYRKLQIRTSIYQELPPNGAGIRLGIYQAEAACGVGATKRNMIRFDRIVGEAIKYRVQLLAFPELYVTGYTMGPDRVRKVAEYRDGPTVQHACRTAKNNGLALLFPYVEKVDASDGTRYFDSIAVIDERGVLLDSYQKTHLYGQQEHDNFDQGHSDYPVHKIFGFPVGVLNCYECEIPELPRILALNGAKLIVGPTAADGYYRRTDGQWSDVPYPDTSQTLLPAWAYSNNLFFAYANRCGYETRDGDTWHYRGNSCVYGPHGDQIVTAGHEQDTLLIADCVPAYYDATHPEPEYNYLRDRRPELYTALTADEAKFYNHSIAPITHETNLFSGGHVYGSPLQPEENDISDEPEDDTDINEWSLPSGSAQVEY